MDQTSIFDLMYQKFKINKPIRLIEFFSGYGSQALALKYLGIPFESWKTCEWAIKSIQAYKDIHFTEDNKDYSKDLTKEQLQEYLFNKGISSNYNEPMTKQQINRLSEDNLRTIYNNIKATHNLVNIQKVKGKDLEIVDTNKYDYILTYSFPCQDLSLAGKGKGMEDTTTRSGMLWEVERILTECKELGTLPQCLLMENVPQVHSQDNLKAWERWLNRLEELGYKNYFQDLIATDYGIPQTRNRCFMISLLGDYNYTFPKPIPLELKLKDMLEDNVEEKYYLSDKMKQYIFSGNDKYKVNQNSLKLNRDIACSKTTREGWTRADTSDYIMEEKGCKQVIDLKYYNHEQSNRVYSPEHSSPTIRTKYDEAGAIKILEEELVGTYDYHQSNNYIGDRDRKHIGKQTSDTLLASGHHNTLLIKNATQKGYLEAEAGDGVDISGRMEYHRGTVQKGMAQTLSTMGGENNGVVLNDLRIRKLTPRECFRLMGVKDQDFDKVKVNQSDSSLYHLAGDSIVVQCLEAIFKELL